jgi:hypothetical protein
MAEDSTTALIKIEAARKTRDRWIERLSLGRNLDIVEERVAFWSNRVFHLRELIEKGE